MTTSPPPVSRGVSERFPWGAPLALALAVIALCSAEFALVGLLVEVAGELRVPVATAGQLLGGYAIAAAVAGPLATLATARVPARRLALGLLAFFAAANSLAAPTPSFPPLMAARMLGPSPTAPSSRSPSCWPSPSRRVTGRPPPSPGWPVASRWPRWRAARSARSSANTSGGGPRSGRWWPPRSPRRWRSSCWCPPAPPSAPVPPPAPAENRAPCGDPRCAGRSRSPRSRGPAGSCGTPT
ncbi:membrane protein of unknown function [Streptantibioticus cattleyicolor NRRL 8057 = DSM 46488]|nr:membrane protein of unknown function [Streptantibioticus cattleyicolor NRRL 8057 = DSM 46488]